MKFVQTSFGNQKGILRFPDHYVAVPVAVDDTGIAANADGKKIVAAGTVIGGDVFNTPTNKVKAANTPASVTLDPTGTNNNILVTAKVFKALKIALVDPAGNSQVLKVQVIKDTIEVLLATSSGGAITSTAAEVIALLNANPVTNSLIIAANGGTDTGAGVVAAVAATALANGSTYAPEGVLYNDVDVTYGPAAGAMLVHAFIDLAKLPAAPSALAVAALHGIAFLK